MPKITASKFRTNKRNKKRNVTLDSNILIAYVVSKHNDSIVRRVVTKSSTEDRLMLTDVIYDECLKYTDKKKARATKGEMTAKLKAISREVINISPLPSDEELLKRYSIRDKDDLKILYSVEMTNSVILVTLDDDFSDIKGLKAKVMQPWEYLNEDELEN